MPDLAGTWELEFITGPRIAFSRLYPNKKPTSTFDTAAETVTGTDSCNGQSSDYTLDGSAIAFGEPGPTTLMYCGQGERVFRDTLAKVDRASVDAAGKLVLSMGDVAMMRFQRR